MPEQIDREDGGLPKAPFYDSVGDFLGRSLMLGENITDHEVFKVVHRPARTGARNWALLFFLVSGGDCPGWTKELKASKAEIMEDFSFATQKNEIPTLIEFALNNASADFLSDVIKITNFSWNYKDGWGRSLVHFLFEPSRRGAFAVVPWPRVLECTHLLKNHGLDLGEPYPSIPPSYSSAKRGAPLWLYTVEQKQWELAVELFPTAAYWSDAVGKINEHPILSPEDRIFYNFCTVLADKTTSLPTPIVFLATHWLKCRGFQPKDISKFPIETCWDGFSWEDRQKILNEWSVPDKNKRTRFHEKLGLRNSRDFSDMVDFLLLNQDLLIAQDDWQEKPWEVWMLAWSSLDSVALTSSDQRLLDWWGRQTRETLLPAEILEVALQNLTKKA